jgi:ABC-2 type transport system ATP-binding protein
MDIRIENLSRRYDRQVAVDGISFEVKKGEILGFLGPNGAGKTTTMKMITSYISIGEGSIFIDNKPISEHAEDLKKSIGYLPENNPLYHDMQVIDYLEFCAALQGVPNNKITERVKKMVQDCGLNAEKHKTIGELSKGYRQRVGLAQAMIHDPAILILDEPTTGLDPNQIVEIRKLIRELGKEKTVILSTHILPEVEATCDRILIINKGKIVANGTAEDLRSQASGQEITKIKIEDADRQQAIDALTALDTVDQVLPLQGDDLRLEVISRKGKSSRRALFSLCASKGWILTEVIPVETKLEDVFRSLTMN